MNDKKLLDADSTTGASGGATFRFQDGAVVITPYEPVITRCDKTPDEVNPLWALAKFGRWCMTEHKADRLSHIYDETGDSIFDQLVDLKLYVQKIDGQKYWDETELAQLPEKK